MTSSAGQKVEHFAPSISMVTQWSWCFLSAVNMYSVKPASSTRIFPRSVSRTSTVAAWEAIGAVASAARLAPVTTVHATSIWIRFISFLRSLRFEPGHAPRAAGQGPPRTMRTPPGRKTSRPPIRPACGPSIRPPSALDAAARWPEFAAPGGGSGPGTVDGRFAAAIDWPPGVRGAGETRGALPHGRNRTRGENYKMASTKRIIAMLVFGLGLLLPAAAAVAAPQYVALGDSYSSGVGTRVFYEESGECDRSPDAYGPKIAAAKGYSLNFEACGGAKTPEVNSKQLGHLSSHHEPRDDHDRRQRRRLQQRDHQLRPLLLHVRERHQRSQRIHQKQTPRAAGNDLQRHPREGHDRESRRAGLPEAVHGRRQDLQRQLPHLGQREENERIGGATRQRHQGACGSRQIHAS